MMAIDKVIEDTIGLIQEKMSLQSKDKGKHHVQDNRSAFKIVSNKRCPGDFQVASDEIQSL